MKVSLIAAISLNHTIARKGRLPWHLPDDLRFFQQKTNGHFVVMGRKTFDTLPQPLSKRENVVLTRQHDLEIRGATVVRTLEEALELPGPSEEEVFIAGGAEIYSLALPRADRLYLTHIHAVVEGDTFFPDPDYSLWRAVETIRHERDDQHEYSFTFATYEKA